VICLERWAGHEIRKARIISPKDGKAVVIAIDHGILMGPVSGLEDPVETASEIIKGHPDAIQCTPAIASSIRENLIERGAPALIARIDASNVWRGHPKPKEGYREMLFSVKDAVRAGADAVVVYFLIGYENDMAEGRNLKEVAAVISECMDYGMPVVVEPIGIAPGYQAVRDAQLIPLAARIAYETGADILKADYTGDAETFSKTVRAVHIPVLIRGGPKTETLKDAFKMVEDAMKAGARGVVFGRNVWQSSNISGMVRAYMQLVHEGKSAATLASELSK
jgi:class I fructose-bisphosphate aldolase